MGQLLLPIFFLVTSVGLFFTYIDGKYSEIQVLLTEQSKLDQALTKSKELQEVRNALISRNNTFTREELDRLQKLLPDNIDNVRLIIDIDNIAAAYNIEIAEFGFSREESVPITESQPIETAVATSQTDTPYGSMVLTFSVSASYADFLKLLRDLERSLRLVDVVQIDVTAGAESKYVFDIAIQTYWLK
jgi:Tfp pilus assembly protein PilO